MGDTLSYPDARKVCFRLSWNSAGQRRCHVLQQGETTVGSQRDNTLVLRAQGVSRRHALLSLEGQELVLRDLASKNGLQVNGRPLTAATLASGDRISLGALFLTLEAIDPADAELGLALSRSPDRGPASAPWPGGEDARADGPGNSADGAAPFDSRDAETTLLSHEVEASLPSLRLLDGFLGHLALRPRPDLEGALALLVAGLEAEAAALIAWSNDAPAVVVASSGPIGDLPTLRPAKRRSPRRLTQRPPSELIHRDTPTKLCGVILQPDAEERLALMLWGDFPARPHSGPLLSTLVHLTWRLWPRPTRELVRPRPSTDHRLRFPPHIVRGKSPAMVSLYQQMLPLLQGDLPVLILGETGVGKEHLARLLHDSSHRRRHAFVAINCAAIPNDLLEAELFGVAQGVATGVQARPGKLLQADGGTLFLDEIGDMPLALQAKLLRALQEKETYPLGSSPIPVDLRVVTATNSDLRQRMLRKAFRQDLFYRIAGFTLDVPPLRQRPEDLPALIGHFIAQCCGEIGKTVRGVTVKALRALTAYGWPGNVRELQHEIRRLVFLCVDGTAIDFDMLSHHIAHPAEIIGQSDDESEGRNHGGSDLELARHLEIVERRLIRRALLQSLGNQTAAAKLLGISRNGLAKRLRRLGMRAETLFSR